MNIDPVNVLKWVGIVLAAGFVGYFGRYLAMRFIEKLGGKKATGGTAATEPPRPGEAEAKLEKKRGKQAAKAAKKAAKNR